MLSLCNALGVCAFNIILYRACQQLRRTEPALKHGHYKCHTHKHSVLCLSKVHCSRIVIHIHCYLVYSGERMHYYHILGRFLHFFGIKAEYILLPVVFLLA